MFIKQKVIFISDIKNYSSPKGWRIFKYRKIKNNMTAIFLKGEVNDVL